MDRIEGDNLNNTYQNMTDEDANIVLHQCIRIIINLRNVGLIHGDLNEFNSLVSFPPIER